MTTIFFTRHGETEWNTQRRMQGWLDSPLTEKGKLQAVYLGERMKAISLATIYSSDAPRATTTADLIRGGRNIPIVPLKELREMCLGEWEGCFVSELFERESVNCQNFFYYPHKFIPPKGAESFEAVQQRAVKALKELVQKHEGQSILIVAHGMLMRIVAAYLRKKSIEDVWSDFYKPTALSLVIADGESFEIKYWNDTSHYKE